MRRETLKIVLVVVLVPRRKAERDKLHFIVIRPSRMKLQESRLGGEGRRRLQGIVLDEFREAERTTPWSFAPPPLLRGNIRV